VEFNLTNIKVELTLSKANRLYMSSDFENIYVDF
jgi:hypothetical protein